MKRLLYILGFSLLTLNIVAQSNIRINNYLENLYYINPAAIDDESAIALSTTARKQWVGFPGSPSTLYATGTTYLENIRTQFGIKLFNDKIGITNIFNFGLSYAYSVKLSSNWQLHLGLAASFQNISYNLTDLSSNYLDDPTFSSKLLKENNYNSDAGFQFKNKSTTIGASSQNLLSFFFEENTIQNNTNYIYGKYRFRSPDPINMQGGISAIKYKDILQMEFNITAFFNSYRHKDVFQAGLFYRTKTEMGAILGINLGQSMHVWYSFDYNVSGLNRSTLGTHELMLVYKLDKKLSRNY